MRGKVGGEEPLLGVGMREHGRSLFSSVSSFGADGRQLMPIAIGLSNSFAWHRVQLHLTIRGSVSRGSN
jgi:hypothetical protein